MKRIDTEEELEGLYGVPAGGSLTKVTTAMTPLYQRWIEAARFVVLTTVGPEGTDSSPRGDDGAVVRIAADGTLMLPDWRGNNRLDSLRNIVRDGRVSLMFLVPGIDNVVRVNGTAILTADPELCETFEQKARHPKTVVIVTIGEMYFQCAKAIMRSKLWTTSGQEAAVPTAGDFLKEATADFDGKTYDANYSSYAKDRMW